MSLNKTFSIDLDQIKSFIWHSISDAFETTILLPIQREDEEEAGTYEGLLLAGTITFKGFIEGCLVLKSGLISAQKIARGMLMMEESEELSEEEMNDAIGEAVNLVIGGLKSRLIEEYGDIKISIPTVTKGRKLKPALGLGSKRISVFAKIENFLIEFVFAFKASSNN